MDHFLGLLFFYLLFGALLSIRYGKGHRMSFTLFWGVKLITRPLGFLWSKLSWEARLAIVAILTGGLGFYAYYSATKKMHERQQAG